TPLYRKLPTPEDMRASEYELERHLARVAALSKGETKRIHRSLVDVDVRPSTAKAPAMFDADAYSPWANVHTPSDRRPRVKTVPPRSAIAFTDEFFANGRSWV